MTKQGVGMGCCENGAVFANPESRKVKEPRNTKYIHFSALTDGEKQAFADFQEKEKRRHQEDIDQIDADLKVMKDRYGIEPRLVYVGAWLEVL
jgi:hypothetical protein